MQAFTKIYKLFSYLLLNNEEIYQMQSSEIFGLFIYLLLLPTLGS